MGAVHVARVDDADLGQRPVAVDGHVGDLGEYVHAFDHSAENNVVVVKVG